MTGNLGRAVNVSLRPTVMADVPALFEMQSDAESNRLAGTKPRDWATFEGVWVKILADEVAAGVTPRVMIADGELVGVINVFPAMEMQWIGYWIARGHWGRGIAGRAVGLLVAEVGARPLFSRVAAHNVASQRALLRNGFVEVSREMSEETERYVGSETVLLRLGE